jgi:hypothetical protein
LLAVKHQRKFYPLSSFLPAVHWRRSKNAWDKLPEKGQAAIQVTNGGRVYTATEIERFDYGQRAA